MQYRRLGQTDITLSAVGLGAWALGGGPDWGPVDENAAMQTVSSALDAGVNVIDTAPIYGESEALLGRALRGRRSDVVISTKCGLRKNGSWTDHDLRPSTIQTQLETSLCHLQTDYIDLYLLHYLDPHVPWQDALNTLVRFKNQGKIRHIGVCNVPPETVTQMAQTGQICCVQEELSLLHPAKGLAALNVCRQYQLGFMAYGSLCGGILSGKYQKEPNLRRADARNYFYKCYRGDNFLQAQHTVARVREVSAQKGVLPAQTALAWVLAQAGVTCALAGARTPMQVAQNAAAAQGALTPEELCYLTK